MCKGSSYSESMSSNGVFLLLIKGEDILENAVKLDVLSRISWRDTVKKKRKNGHHVTSIACNRQVFYLQRNRKYHSKLFYQSDLQVPLIFKIMSQWVCQKVSHSAEKDIFFKNHFKVLKKFSAERCRVFWDIFWLISWRKGIEDTTDFFTI